MLLLKLMKLYAPPELRSARVSFNLLIIVSHITVSGCDVPNTRRVLRHTSFRVASACRRSARVDFGSMDMVSALFLRMQRVKSWSGPRAHRTAGMVFCARALASSNRSRLLSGPSGKFCYNILSDTVRIAARCGPVARRRRRSL